MPATSETIVSATTHPGDSTAETVTSEKFKGDGYYGRSDGYTLFNTMFQVWQAQLKCKAH